MDELPFFATWETGQGAGVYNLGVKSAFRWVASPLTHAPHRRTMYTLPGVQTTQEMQHLREQVSNIDQILRIQQPQPQLNQLNSQRITLMAKLQTLVRQQQGAQIMQYPQGTPQQSISQAMQWMPPHPSQPRAPRRQMADPKEVQHRALAKLHMAPAPVPDQLGPEGAAAVQRRRGLLEAHDELERNNTWMQELLSPFDATTKQEPPETWDAIRERLTAWQVRPSHAPPSFAGPTSSPPPSPPPARAPRVCLLAAGAGRAAASGAAGAAREAAHGHRAGAWTSPSAPPSLPTSPPRSGAC
jgi:hypothetical protein